VLSAAAGRVRRLLPERVPRAAAWNLGIVGAFALTAVALLTLTSLDAHTVAGDVHNSVDPQLASTNLHLSALPMLDTSNALTAQVAAAAAPVGADLAHTQATNAAIADRMRGIATDSDGTRESVDSITASVTTITADLGSLEALIRGVDSGLGDLVGNLRHMSAGTRGIAQAFDGTTATVARLTDLTGWLGQDVGDVPVRMKRIRWHTENIAAAEALARIDEVGHKLRLPRSLG
jgi:hypothetical protein